MAHVWNEHYYALYDRTFRILYDAGIDEERADKLARQHTLSVALRSVRKTARFGVVTATTGKKNTARTEFMIHVPYV